MLMSAGEQGQEHQLFWLIFIRSNPFSIIPSGIARYALLEILDRGEGVIREEKWKSLIYKKIY